MDYNNIIIETVHLGKRFGEFDALKDINIRLEQNKVHALLGENGAGKSTLVNCLVGNYIPTSGQYSIFNKERKFLSPKESQALGIGMIHQHFTVVENMSVIDNFILVREPIPFFIHWEKEKELVLEFMNKMPFQINPDRKVYSLSAGEKQKLEILKQLYFERKILILDEPTSVLNPREADEILGFLKDETRRRDFTILMITHKFKEVFSYADEVTVLRKGELAGSVSVTEATESGIAEMMVGNSVSYSKKIEKKSGDERKEKRLSFHNLFCKDSDGRPLLEGLSFFVNSGEIYGIAGVSGNGQKGIVDILSGQKTKYEGAVLASKTPYKASQSFFQEKKIRLLPELPLKNSASPGMSVSENLALRNFSRPPISTHPLFYSRKAINKQAQKLIDQYQISTPSSDTPIENLSGGNVQRTILARELHEDPELLIVANPCFGLDFSATESIHSRIIEARNRGGAIVLISDDLDEVLELSDRIGVIFEGKIQYECEKKEFSRAVIGQYMAGKNIETV